MLRIFRYTTSVWSGIFPCILGLLITVSAAGADLSGIWTGTLTDRNGDPQDLSFRFSQKGETLAGKMYGDNESTMITSTKVTGDQVTFSVRTELNGQITNFLFTGTVQGDQMDLSRVRVDSGPAANSAKPPQGQTFHLKRLT
jgi:hypothetical protein